MIKPTSKLVGIIGSPIVQVKMPDMLNAAFAARNLDMVMIPLDIGRGGIDAFVTVLRNWNNLLGCVVTVPHKQAFAPHIDDLSARSRRLGAVNVIRRNGDGTLAGDMVDGPGFVSALARHGVNVEGKRVAQVGAGGAGSAVADALCAAGAASLAIFDSDGARLGRVTAMLAGGGYKTRVTDSIESLSGYDLVVNATPCGMNGDQSLPLPPEAMAELRAETFVADIVTMPAITPFLATAQARGCRTQGGADMAAAEMEMLGKFVGAF